MDPCSSQLLVLVGWSEHITCGNTCTPWNPHEYKVIWLWKLSFSPVVTTVEVYDFRWSHGGTLIFISMIMWFMCWMHNLELLCQN